MAKIASDIRDFVTDKVIGTIQTVTNSPIKRKVALITGITGQVIIIKS
jgi:hypothetical protein